MRILYYTGCFFIRINYDDEERKKKGVNITVVPCIKVSYHVPCIKVSYLVPCMRMGRYTEKLTVTQM